MTVQTHDIAERLRAAGLRPTRQRVALARLLFDGCDRHVTAEVLHEEALARNPIDRERVFVGGISNGGFMALRLACAAPGLIRGIVSISGAGPLEPVTETLPA